MLPINAISITDTIDKLVASEYINKINCHCNFDKILYETVNWFGENIDKNELYIIMTMITLDTIICNSGILSSKLFDIQLSDKITLFKIVNANIKYKYYSIINMMMNIINNMCQCSHQTVEDEDGDEFLFDGGSIKNSIYMNKIKHYRQLINTNLKMNDIYTYKIKKYNSKC